MATSNKLPGLPWFGGCQCGKIRYTVSEKPLVFYFCHCTECQRHTSSAFGQSLRVAASAVEVDGDVAITTRNSASGTIREGLFCPDCGVRLIHRSNGNPHYVNIKAGTLDDTSWLVPAGHIWMKSKQPWFEAAVEELVFETQPEGNYDALVDRWREMFPEDY